MQRAARAALALPLIGCVAGTLEIDRRGDRPPAQKIAVVTRSSMASATGCAAGVEGRGQVATPTDLSSALFSSSGFFATIAERTLAQAVISPKVEVFVRRQDWVKFVTAEWIDPPTGEILAIASLDADIREELSISDAGKRVCAALVAKRR